MSNRRQFLQSSLTTAGVVAWGTTAPQFLSRTALAAESVARREDAEIARGALRVRPNGYQQPPPRADDDEDKCRETGGDETDALGTKPRPGRCDTVCACRQID